MGSPRSQVVDETASFRRSAVEGGVGGWRKGCVGRFPEECSMTAGSSSKKLRTPCDVSSDLAPVVVEARSLRSSSSSSRNDWRVIDEEGRVPPFGILFILSVSTTYSSEEFGDVGLVAGAVVCAMLFSVS